MTLSAYLGETDLSNLGITLQDKNGSTVLFRQTSGIQPLGGGWYFITDNDIHIPSSAAFAIWDDSVVTDVIAIESFDCYKHQVVIHADVSTALSITTDDGVATTITSGGADGPAIELVPSGSGYGLNGTLSDTPPLRADLENIQSRIPETLISGRVDATVGGYQSGLVPLQPTVAGRTLDVTIGGEAGIDWGNIGNATFTVNFSGTTVAAVSGAVTVGTINGNAITAASIASGAITAEKIAAGAIGADALASDAATEIANAANTALTAAHGAGSWQTNDVGAGAFTITVTVTDGSVPVENASVRVTNGPDSYAVTTDSGGHAQFALEAATYAVAVTRLGFSFIPTNRTVTGNESGTLTNALVMTQSAAIAHPDDAAKCRVYAYLFAKDGTPVRNAELTATLDTVPVRAGAVLVAASLKALSDSDGFVALDLYLTAGLAPAGAKWIIEIPAAGYSRTTVLTTSTLDLGTLIA